MMTAVAQQLSAGPALAELIEFVHAELDLLDRRQFEDWSSLFTEDGFYWAPIDPEQPDPLRHVSLFYDDKPGMKMRIYRLRHPMIHMQTPPSRFLHLVTSFREVTEEAGAIRFKCNFIMFEYRRTRQQSIVGGTYEYTLVRNAEGKLQIKEKKATLVNSEDSFPSLAIWF